MAFDDSCYHRLTNDRLGPERSLALLPGGTGRLGMVPGNDDRSQKWRLLARGPNRWALQTAELGDCFSLDVINDGIGRTPRLAESGDYSGQYWTITPSGGDTYRLFNDFTGPHRFLCVDAATHEPVIDADPDGQRWTLTRTGAIPAPVPVPELDPGGFVSQTEGPTDYRLFARPDGVVRAVMVFVDFPDAAGDANPTTPSATADHLLGNGAAQQLFNEQSYGRLTLDVTVRSDLGWRRMPLPSSRYHFAEADPHRVYIHTAASLFAGEVDFSRYPLVFIVATQAAAFPLSPAFTQWPGGGAATPNGEIRLAVTVGADSYRNRFVNLVHEVGHLFGLPDLYTYQADGAEDSRAGCWDIMSDIFRSVSFLGWHRHKAGWLPASRATYLREPVSGRPVTLHPLTGTCGLSMLVLPLDDASRPAKVVVVELAQPVLGTGGEFRGEGVLVYTVDATRDGGATPVVVIPRVESHSDDFGNLHEAPYDVGDVAHLAERSASLTVRVLGRFGSSYQVEVDFHGR